MNWLSRKILHEARYRESVLTQKETIEKNLILLNFYIFFPTDWRLVLSTSVNAHIICTISFWLKPNSVFGIQLNRAHECETRIQRWSLIAMFDSEISPGSGRSLQAAHGRESRQQPRLRVAARLARQHRQPGWAWGEVATEHTAAFYWKAPVSNKSCYFNSNVACPDSVLDRFCDILKEMLPKWANVNLSEEGKATFHLRPKVRIHLLKMHSTLYWQ